MTTAPDSEAYAVVNEDSGFTAALGTPGDEPALQRSGAGVADGARVCVLYDRTSDFARGAFASLRETALEAGWNAVDCGADDIRAALAERQWDAVITRVPIPQTPDQIAAQWGSQSAESITGNGDEHRDELITQLSQTVDVYQAREVRAQIEASIVRAAVALPIAVNPRVTIVQRGVGAVKARNGAGATLMWGAATWTIAPS
jgi:peptide/nickel transport system substrate-binding protein